MRKTSNATLRFGNFWNQTSSALREGDSELDCFAQRHLRYFVHHHFVGNAAQCRVLLDRPDLLFLQDRDHPGGFDHRCGDMDLLRRRQALHPRGDVDGLAEIILPFVEHDRKTWAFMDADLDDQVLAAALFVELTHRSAHFQARHQRVFGTNERRYHRIADGLHHGTFLRRDDVEQRAEMRAHQIERGEVPDPLIERSRPLQVGEQESQRGDLQPLIDIEIVGLEDVAESLVGQHALCRKERPALAEQLMQLVAGNEDAGQHAQAGLVVERQPQGSRTQGRRSGRRMRLVVDQRKLLTLLGRLALYVDELGGVRYRLEHDDEVRRQLQRHHGLLVRRQLQRLEGYLVLHRGKVVLVEVDPGAPENLPVVFPERQRVWLVCGNPSDLGADGEGDLDLLVDGGLIAASTKPAMIVVGAQRFQRVVGTEYTAAAGAQHVPAQIEQAKPRGVQEPGNHLLFVERVVI